MEEIPALQIDLLTVLARIYQGRDLIRMIDENTARLVTNDAPTLARRLTEDALKWCALTDLDTGFPVWLRMIRCGVTP